MTRMGTDIGKMKPRGAEWRGRVMVDPVIREIL